jgi:hypothetical protein
MKLSANYRVYLYVVLLITLIAAAYLKYNEGKVNVESDSLEVVNGTPQKLALSAGTAKIINESNHRFFPKVDIFETYKTEVKNIREVLPKKHKAKVLLQENLINNIAPVAPVAPPLPFKYIGKIYGDDEYQVFVTVQGKSYVVKVGDVIQTSYKIEQIAPPVMVVKYIPLDELQNINIGEFK